jgi:hypothetical protein
MAIDTTNVRHAALIVVLIELGMSLLPFVVIAGKKNYGLFSMLAVFCKGL